MRISDHLQRIWLLFSASLGVITGNRKLLLCSVATTGMAFGLIILMVAAPILPIGLKFWREVRSLPDHKSAGGAGRLHFEITRSQAEAGAATSSALAPTSRDGETAEATFNIDLSSRQTLIYFAAAYLLIVFSWTFANVALSHEVFRALNGDEVSIRRGLRFAVGRIRSIFIWSIFAGSLGVLLHLLQPHIKWIGRTLFGSIELMWSVATAFVVPVLIREKSSNPLTLVKTSSATVRHTWGESLAGYWGYTAAFVLGCIPAFGLALLAPIPALLGWNQAWIWAVPVAGLGAIALVGASVVLFEAAWQVYCCSLYVYATEGVIPAPFSQEQMDQAWVVRKPE